MSDVIVRESGAIDDCMRRLPCIPFAGAKRRNGYGYTQFLGRQVLAHRLAFALNNYMTPDQLRGSVIRHACDNRACINASHLLIGSYSDNARDMVERGRQRKGEGVQQHKLTAAEAVEILRLYRPRKRGYTQRELAKRYGVSQSAISLLVSGKNWRHVDRMPNSHEPKEGTEQ